MVGEAPAGLGGVGELSAQRRQVEGAASAQVVDEPYGDTGFPPHPVGGVVRGQQRQALVVLQRSHLGGGADVEAAAAGHQDAYVGQRGQQRTQLRLVGGVVQDGEGVAAAQFRAYPRDALRRVDQRPHGRVAQAEELQEAVEDGVRRRRLAFGVEAVQVGEEHRVAAVPGLGEQAADPQGQLGLADPGRAVQRQHRRRTRQFPCPRDDPVPSGEPLAPGRQRPGHVREGGDGALGGGDDAHVAQPRQARLAEAEDARDVDDEVAVEVRTLLGEAIGHSGQ